MWKKWFAWYPVFIFYNKTNTVNKYLWGAKRVWLCYVEYRFPSKGEYQEYREIGSNWD